jgi:hypothetical protein
MPQIRWLIVLLKLIYNFSLIAIILIAIIFHENYYYQAILNYI